ncbi:MAG: manganese efflux pump [Oscillospiraceae bacterium]|nr:manganese efflux pump [Oscillospiraceae bacterium]
MTFAFFVNSALLGVGLAMDAFSVSCANGLHEPRMKPRRMAVIAGVYAWFQFLMPMIGWVCVHAIVETFTAFQAIIPWIALGLLLWIGGGMLREGIRGGDEDTERALTPAALLLQGVATSIDALSVGFTIAEYDGKMALLASLIIAAVTFAICMGGLFIGRKVGTRLSGKASILGGVILILIGIEIFVTGI